MPGKAMESWGGSGRAIQCNAVKIQLNPAMEKLELQNQLQELAKEISSSLSALETSQSRELLGGFVSDLFLNVAAQDQREARRQKQMDGIAAARARGVHIGRRPIQVTGEFADMAEQWASGQISAAAAAGELGMSRDTFLRRAKELRTVSQE